MRLVSSSGPAALPFSHYLLSGLTRDADVSVGRSSGATLALGCRLVVSVVVVVCVVVVQPTSAKRPAQANNLITFFMLCVLSESRCHCILFCHAVKATPFIDIILLERLDSPGKAARSTRTA